MMNRLSDITYRLYFSRGYLSLILLFSSHFSFHPLSPSNERKGNPTDRHESGLNVQHSASHFDIQSLCPDIRTSPLDLSWTHFTSFSTSYIAKPVILEVACQGLLLPTCAGFSSHKREMPDKSEMTSFFMLFMSLFNLCVSLHNFTQWYMDNVKETIERTNCK